MTDYTTMIKLHPKDAETQHNWLEQHNKANLISIGPKPFNLPAIAVYVNPVWRDKVNTKNILTAISDAIQHYENES